MRKYISRFAMGAAACLVAASLSGCADTVGPFPRLGAISNTVKQKLLSSEEQEAAIRELSLEGANQRSSAEREIAKP